MMLKANINNQGFTLVEMTIVLVVLGFVLATLLMPLRAQREQIALTQTTNTLDNAKQALLGFAQANGRLPCPATNNGTAIFPDDTGTSNPSAGGVCLQSVGFLPARTLGIEPADNLGYALDAWGQRIRYAVNQANNANVVNADFTTANAMTNQGLSNLQPNLRVCASQVGITATRCSGGVETNFLINNAVAVIYSVGATGRLGSAGKADELANLDADTVFVSHDINFRQNNNDPTEFDHIVTWISPYVLYNVMIQAGQLH